MNIDDVIKILLVCGSLTAGAVLTAIRNKLGSLNEKNRLHFVFYIYGSLVIILCILTSIFYRKQLLAPNWLGIIAIGISIISSIALISFTKKYLVGKHDYKTVELNPIINEFTLNADKENISLYGGDLDFFGKNPDDMDRNSQYIQLRGAGFRKIQILCEYPHSNTNKIRYGKITNDMPYVELKFYEPKKADLKIRGRMKTLNGVKKLLIYIRVTSGVYRIIQPDTANYNGALYENILDLIWSQANPIKPEELKEYKSLL